MGPLLQTHWRSTDVEKYVQRWDPCHVDWVEILHRYREDSRQRTSHVDLWRWRLYGDGTSAMWTQRSIDVEKAVCEEIYGCREGVQRWDPCHVDSEEIYRCRAGVWRWDPCHVNSEEICRCREGVQRWDLCHVDSVEIYRCREGCTEMGPLPCGLEGDLARYRECQILGRTWSVSYTHLTLPTRRWV